MVFAFSEKTAFGSESCLGAHEIASKSIGPLATHRTQNAKALLANQGTFACFEHRAAKIYVLIALTVLRAASRGICNLRREETGIRGRVRCLAQQASSTISRS